MVRYLLVGEIYYRSYLIEAYDMLAWLPFSQMLYNISLGKLHYTGGTL